MQTLRYKTRGNADPHGKPRIFFTSHPDDFERYFEWTAEELLKYQDAAVWYLPEECPPGAQEDAADDLETLLSQMQLFVIPVTTRLLTDPGVTLQRIFPLSQRLHIPVLPLMMESGLDELFRERFGDLQYLQPENDDPTATPFGERLEKFLSRVLTGDDLAQRVRDAFDAYIFLSYRKKDRRYAQELMRMIHGSDRWRDIAIWYDEYLVPGEDFNAAIRGALEKSRLFALVVTPSLLEEGNYVMKYEYPAAKEAGKDILPFEMRETDRDLLHRFYEDVPEGVHCGDLGRWEELFLDYLKKIASGAGEKDPVHNFLIGLAYLDGIDVEVDSSKAFDLISGAAETGLIEASQKLVHMYRDGKGVPRDYGKALAQQEKLAALMRDRYRGSGDPEDRGALFEELLDLSDSFYAVRRMSSAEEALLEALKLTDEEDTNYKKYSRRYRCYDALGDLEAAYGRPERAADYYRKSLAYREFMAEGVKTGSVYRDLSNSYISLGDLEVQLGHMQEAETWYQKCLEIREKLAAEAAPGEDRELAQEGLASVLGQIGRAREMQGRLDEADGYYRRSLELLEVLAAEKNTPWYRRKTAILYRDIGSVCEQKGAFKEAKAWYLKSLKIREELAEALLTIRARQDLARCCIDMGWLEEQQGHSADAESWYQRGMSIRRKLAGEAGTADIVRDLWSSHIQLGDLKKRQKKADEAVTHYRESLRIAEALQKMPGDERRSLLISCGNLGEMEAARGNYDEAAAWYQKALEIAEALADKALADGALTTDERFNLCITCNNLARVLQDGGHAEQALAYYQKGVRIMEALFADTKSIRAEDMLGILYYNIGDLKKDVSCLQRACDVWERLTSRVPQHAGFRERLETVRKRMKELEGEPL